MMFPDHDVPFVKRHRERWIRSLFWLYPRESSAVPAQLLKRWAHSAVRYRVFRYRHIF